MNSETFIFSLVFIIIGVFLLFANIRQFEIISPWITHRTILCDIYEYFVQEEKKEKPFEIKNLYLLRILGFSVLIIGFILCIGEICSYIIYR
jgi:hypothetical protein